MTQDLDCAVCGFFPRCCLPIIEKNIFTAFYSQNKMPGSEVARQAAADAVYYVTLNLIGFYVRYVGEINMRRGFLDKRGCIETTFKLKYEKEQEVLLLITFNYLQFDFLLLDICCLCFLSHEVTKCDLLNYLYSRIETSVSFSESTALTIDLQIFLP